MDGALELVYSDRRVNGVNVERIVGLAWVLVLVASGARAGVVCVTPDGRVHAGDRPPANCEAKTSYRGLAKSSTTPSNPDDAAALARRDEIERQADDASRELAAVQLQLAAIPDISPAAYENGPAGWQAYERNLAARDAAAGKLRSRQSELLWQLGSLKRDFDVVAASLAGAHGGRLPRWWGPLRCAKCP